MIDKLVGVAFFLAVAALSVCAVVQALNRPAVNISVKCDPAQMPAPELPTKEKKR